MIEISTLFTNLLFVFVRQVIRLGEGHGIQKGIILILRQE
jgi:hypothetical protein